jgi:ATP-dependent DNA ligase
MPILGRPVFPAPFVAYALARFPPAPITFQPPGFILPWQPALADRPPSGPGWLHEIKFDGYRVIAGKDGDQVRLWARTTSDYSSAFTRIRDAVAALPVDSAVLDGEAIVFCASITLPISRR